MEKVITKKNSTPKLKIIILVLFTMILVVSFVGIGRLMGAINPVVRYFEHQVVAYRVRNYQQMETEHFIIKHEEVDEEILNLVAETAENKYQQATKIFEYQPNGKILLVLYDNPDPMMKVTTLRKGTPPMGVYYGDALHILDPNEWVGDPNELKETFQKEGPVLHELVHLFVDHSAKGNFPIWFTEGVSLYFEYEVDGYQWGKGVQFQDGEYTLEDLNHSFGDLDQYMAYTKSFRIVKGYVDEHGKESLIQLINDLGRGEQLENYYHLFEE